MSLAHVALLSLIYSLSSNTSPCFVSDDTAPKPLRIHFNFLLVPKRFQGPRSNFEVDGGGAPLVTQSWGTRHFFLLTIYNFKIIGGHAPPPPASLLRVSWFEFAASDISSLSLVTQVLEATKIRPLMESSAGAEIRKLI